MISRRHPPPVRRKIVQLTLNMRIGGAEQVVATLARCVDKTRFDNSVLCLEDHIGPLGAKLAEEGYSVRHFSRRPGFDVSLVFRIRKLIFSERVDVLHCHQYTPYVYGALAAVGTGCRVIFTEHGRFFPDTRKAKRFVVNPLLCRLTSSITAISVATKEALITYENFPRERIQVVYNGIEVSNQVGNQPVTRESLGISEDAKVLGTVARLDPIKNQSMMIRALAKVLNNHPVTYLLIVGDGPERNMLEEQARRLGVADHVRFTGYRVDVDRYYPLIDIFLLTSLSEGTAMTLLESMAWGIPCVVTGVGGNPEIVLESETGFVVPSDDADALVSTIERLLEDNTLLLRFGEAGRRRFHACFTAEQMAKAYEALYAG